MCGGVFHILFLGPNLAVNVTSGQCVSCSDAVFVLMCWVFFLTLRNSAIKLLTFNFRRDFDARCRNGETLITDNYPECFKKKTPTFEYKLGANLWLEIKCKLCWWILILQKYYKFKISILGNVNDHHTLYSLALRRGVGCVPSGYETVVFVSVTVKKTGLSTMRKRN